jgi:hypothetical protein
VLVEIYRNPLFSITAQFGRFPLIKDYEIDIAFSWRIPALHDRCIWPRISFAFDIWRLSWPIVALRGMPVAARFTVARGVVPIVALFIGHTLLRSL